MIELLSELSAELPVEMTSGLLIANVVALIVCISGLSLLSRWLFPFFQGKVGREPVCFRQTSKSTLKASIPSPPILLTGFWIAFQLFFALKSEFIPRESTDPDLNMLITNAVLQLAIGGFLIFLWEFSPLPGNVSDYFRVDDWKTELQAGTELMLLVFPWTILLGILSSLWKTPEDLHPLLQVLQNGNLDLILGIGITAVIIAPLAEELLFRVLLLNGLIELTKLNRLVAWIVVSVSFSLAHGFADALQLLPLSLSLGWCLLRRQSYLAIVTAHALFNGLMMFISLMSFSQ